MSAEIFPREKDIDGKSKIIEVTPVISAAAYTSGDAFGAVQVITTPVRKSGGTAVLQNISVCSKKALKSQYDFIFFRNSPTATNNAVFDPTDAQVLDDCLGTVTIFAGQYTAFSSNSVGTLPNIGLIMDTIPSGTTIYCVQVIRNAHTYAIGDIVNKFGFLQD